MLALNYVELKSVVVSLLKKVQDTTGSRVLSSVDGDNAYLAGTIVNSASKERNPAP